VPVVVIGFGSNLGDRNALISQAAEILGVDRLSPLYETAPMYVVDQPAFVNAVGIMESQQGPLALLKKLKEVEAEVGRIPRERNGPREIDLDLIAYGRLQLRSIQRGKNHLHIPHPRLIERRFVLQPLNDLDPGFELAGLGKVQHLLAATDDQAASVVRME
jgi:2-amino-4-hydroxy-6-hydroxymethyldihydropteridine diphosphokinase